MWKCPIGEEWVTQATEKQGVRTHRLFTCLVGQRIGWLWLDSRVVVVYGVGWWMVRVVDAHRGKSIGNVKAAITTELPKPKLRMQPMQTKQSLLRYSSHQAINLSWHHLSSHHYTQFPSSFLSSPGWRQVHQNKTWLDIGLTSEYD